MFGIFANLANLGTDSTVNLGQKLLSFPVSKESQPIIHDAIVMKRNDRNIVMFPECDK